jgi:hypothetical protein
MSLALIAFMVVYEIIEVKGVDLNTGGRFKNIIRYRLPLGGADCKNL